MKKAFATAAIVCVAFGSCTTGKVSNATLQENLPGRWNIVEVAGLNTLESENTPFINFTDSGTVNGNLSVNTFFGTYKVNGDSVSFGNMGMTMMAGPGMENEIAINVAIGKCVTMELKDSLLNAKDKDGNIVMTLKRD